MLLTVGILTIPVVSDYSNHLIAEQAVSQTARWFCGHLISGVAFGVSVLAAYSINIFLSRQGQARTGIVSLTLVAVGATLYAFGLGADSIGPLATAEGGGRVMDFFEGSGMWVSGVFIAASIIFGAGLITQIVGVIRANLFGGVLKILVFVAAVIFVGAGAIPSDWGLWIIGAMSLVVYISIGVSIWHRVK